MATATDRVFLGLALGALTVLAALLLRSAFSASYAPEAVAAGISASFTATYLVQRFRRKSPTEAA